MKFHCFIGAFFLMLTVACHRPVETVCTPSLQPKLIAIDTLMQSRPDSALKALYSCTDTSNVSASDRHYYQLLLSEALYKNDFAQQNRPELLDAMAYFDSIGDAFLSARCHHMNGVGYYEMDSVVAACAEYMKAVEIMESHFEERDLMEYKAKFMALAYTHLSVLFSDQYLHEQAIYFGKCALFYYNRYDAEPWHVAWVLDEIGMHHDMMEQWDSAWTYYSKGLELLTDTNSLIYRDITAHVTYLSYKKGEDSFLVLKKMHNLINQALDEKEYLSRCLTIGEFYYNENLYDSAWGYYNKVFDRTKSVGSKKLAAKRLVEICKSKGINSELSNYAVYLAQFATVSEQQGTSNSVLMELYQKYIQTKIKRINKYKNRTIIIGTIGITGCLIVLTIITLIHNKNIKRRNKKLDLVQKILQEKLEETSRMFEKKQTAEKAEHYIQQKAMGERLKNSNEKLKETKKKLDETEAELKRINQQSTHENHPQTYEVFLNSPICTEIKAIVSQLYQSKNQILKTDLNVKDYERFALSSWQKAQLSKTTHNCFPTLFYTLKTTYPDIKGKDWLYCCLYLMQLNKMTICILLQDSYQSVRRRTNKIEQELKATDGIVNYLLIFVTT